MDLEIVVPLLPCMSKLREKSEFNLSAAETLLKETLYAPSVHCSYYSCFQLLKYTIKEFSGEDYDTQAANISATQQKTHQYVINYICNELIRFEGIEGSRKFKHKIKDLKQYRVESDYEDVEVSLDKGEQALRLAQEIRRYMIEKFNV